MKLVLAGLHPPPSKSFDALIKQNKHNLSYA